jgi:hypothetical protein
LADQFHSSALPMLKDSIDARVALASLILEDAKEDEAISLLSPPKDLGNIVLIRFTLHFKIVHFWESTNYPSLSHVLYMQILSILIPTCKTHGGLMGK